MIHTKTCSFHAINVFLQTNSFYDMSVVHGTIVCSLNYIYLPIMMQRTIGVAVIHILHPCEQHYVQLYMAHEMGV